MARKHDPSIRLALRDRAVDYVIANGLVGLSLRPLAEALGTNARMLIYHFGSREGLMREILASLREREGPHMVAWFRAGRRPSTLAEFLRWYWRRLSSPRARPGALMIFELYALALRDPAAFPGVLEEPVAFWETLTREAGIRSRDDRRSLATFLLAATRGLLLDLTATGDVRRVNRAFAKLCQIVETLEPTCENASAACGSNDSRRPE